MTCRLKEPPLVEVVCGFSFPWQPTIDPMTIGRFWSDKREQYPAHELHPAVVDVPTFATGVGPLRSWLVSKDGDYLIQIQPDRLYFNWRKRKGAYPHFRDDGDQPGVLTRGLAEFAAFQSFCDKEKDQLGGAPTPQRLEVTKVDMLEADKHWKGREDLMKLLPALRPFLELLKNEDFSLNVALVELRPPYEVRIDIANAIEVDSGAGGIRLQTRVLSPAGTTASSEVLIALNDVANDVFFQLVPSTELGRFGGTK